MLEVSKSSDDTIFGSGKKAYSRTLARKRTAGEHQIDPETDKNYV